MRRLSGAVIGLYPHTWRERYGEEVRDLLSEHPARFGTLVDLLYGALDAWAHRGLIPGGEPSMKIRIPAAAIFGAGGLTLLTLWNPGIHDMSSLERGWTAAAPA
ncbi:hypothetical protein [Planotetraspora sp. GP83]|uniref:hypothetical protein n=1 Tax=Planotetraspora sp. GP83 TaxID=3156264 RepID=UPI0035110F4E